MSKKYLNHSMTKSLDVHQDNGTGKRSASVAAVVQAIEATAKGAAEYDSKMTTSKLKPTTNDKTVINKQCVSRRPPEFTQMAKTSDQKYGMNSSMFSDDEIVGDTENIRDATLSFKQGRLVNTSQTGNVIKFEPKSIGHIGLESHSSEHSLSPQATAHIYNHKVHHKNTDVTLKDTKNGMSNFICGISSDDTISRPISQKVDTNWKYRRSSIGNSSSVEIEVDPSSTLNPHDYWESFMKDQVGPVKEITPLDPESEIGHNCIRFVCISDTHDRISPYNMHNFIGRVPMGDVLLHTGDFTLHGDDLQEYEDFNHLLSLLPHRLKLVIPGNHELYLDPRLHTSYDKHLRSRLGMSLTPREDDPTEHIEHLKSVISNAKVLIDSMVKICGIKIYGLPWIPQYGVIGFGLERGYKLLKKYNQIPAGIDILMSHGPALGFCDVTHRGLHAGCAELLNSVRQRIKPKYVVHGHIHEAHGIQSDGTIIFINSAICDRAYDLSNDPIVFDYPLPHPYTREDFMKLKLEDL